MVSRTDVEDSVLAGAPAEEYAGPAVLSSDGREVAVDAHLRGHFEPLDGRFHWYGRIRVPGEISRALRSGAEVVLATPQGSAEGRLSDLDPWGRFRITGTGRPPF